MSTRPHAVAFDVLETLLNLDPLRARLEEIGQPAQLLQPWFMRFQRDSMALTLSGDFGTFESVARQALRTDTGHTATEADIDHVLEGFGQLPAHPDAEPALRLLSEAGLRVGCLTVGSAENTARFLERAGLARHVDQVVTAEQAGIWKPAPSIYRVTAHELGTTPAHMALVAVHAWDCHGAKRAGCLAGWCERLEGRYGDVFTAPDVSGPDLVQVAERLLQLPSS
ncbi:2-haloacid dehalogenase [Halopolyspora algeriensis]|uniref:2-haloacid dehalogenase n=1 Tax=Halopolyspora algeriensis TaxID=1500506 RepID=A0A368W171_9ACTN|nr:haloacid dehalogenase type II [Halopolyspora algeriensis]RCW46964.1 2-haloacid dehalogenase [Halopolyspora algeriensis]TQM48055.1 2-haloacid dehalogenase [Halopolyspora algeriensis]